MITSAFGLSGVGGASAAAATEFGINPFDAQIGVQWPVKAPGEMIISERDKQHPGLDSLKAKSN